MRFILRIAAIAIIVSLYFKISEATLTPPTRMFNAASKDTPSGTPVVQLQNHAPNFIEFATRFIDGKPLMTSETKTIISVTTQQILLEQEAQKKQPNTKPIITNPKDATHSVLMKYE